MIDALYSTSADTIRPGNHSSRYGLERTCIAAMGGVAFPIADLLTQQPIDTGAEHNAAPTFEFHRFHDVAPKKDQLIAMCNELLGPYPSLGGDDGVRRLLARLPSL